MPPKKLIAIYCLAGPPIGALFVTGAALAEGSSWSHSFQLFRLALVLSFPIGIAPALAAALTHAFLSTRLKPLLAIPSICSASLVAMAIPAIALGRPEAIFQSWSNFAGFALPPLFTSFLLASILLRFSRMQPNPSIELTSNGLRPSAAAHVKR